MSGGPPRGRRRRVSTRGRCSPRSGPARAAHRAGRRAPGGARGPRRARERVPERAPGRVHTRALGLAGRHRKPEILARAPRARLCRCLSSALPLFRLPPWARPWALFPGRRTEASVLRDHDSPAPLPPSGVPGDLSPRRSLWPGRQCLGNRAPPQGGTRDLRPGGSLGVPGFAPLRGRDPATPPCPAGRGEPQAGNLTARPVYPDSCWGWGVEPRLLLGAWRMVHPSQVRTGDRRRCCSTQGQACPASAHTGLWPLWVSFPRSESCVLASEDLPCPTKGELRDLGGQSGPSGVSCCCF